MTLSSVGGSESERLRGIVTDCHAFHFRFRRSIESDEYSDTVRYRSSRDPFKGDSMRPGVLLRLPATPRPGCRRVQH
jgi:hypothetical protein